ncbi:MAG TPA: DUF58 domain-containing protein [Candidatus Polarisedimenticolia bacterium]|nr:DUF58 domain-containing protein [Candidatus Polarisedimenticolia bacterium]
MSAPAAGAAPAPSLAPGRMGLRLAVLSAAIALAAINTGNNLLYLMLSLVLGLAAVSVAAARLAVGTLAVHVRLPDEAVCGRPMVATVRVRGRFRFLPQTWIDVTLAGPPCSIRWTVALPAATGQAAAAVQAIPVRRGLYERLPVIASTGYPLDLRIARRRLAWEGSLAVLPAFEPIRSLRWPGGSAGARPGEASSPRQAGAGVDLRTLRAYAPGDDARRIDWRSTARSGTAMVREFDRDEERRLRLVLDTEAPSDEAFEAVVSLAAAIADLARRERLELSLELPGGRVLTDQAAIRRALAAVTRSEGGAGADGRAGRVPPGGGGRGSSLVLSADPARATPLGVG